MDKINKLITTESKLKDFNPKLATQIAKDYKLKEDDVCLIRKGLIPKDMEIKEGERAIISYINTGAVDRDHEIVDPKGGIFTQYLDNPIVLFGHDYSSLPIGKSEWLKLDSKGIISKTIYAKHPEAEKVFQYRKDGFPLAESIGFAPVEWEDYTTEEEQKEHNGAIRKYTKWVLLEYSDVPVPSNPEALELAISKGLVPKLDPVSFNFELSDFWHDVVKALPETGMGFQIVDIKLVTGKIMKNVAVINCQVVMPKEKIDPKEIVGITLSKNEDKKELFLTEGSENICYMVNPELEDSKVSTYDVDKGITALISDTDLVALRFDKKEFTAETVIAYIKQYLTQKSVLVVKPPLEEVEKYIEEQKQKAIDEFIKEGRTLSSKTKSIIRKAIEELTKLIAVDAENAGKEAEKALDVLIAKAKDILTK